MNFIFDPGLVLYLPLSQLDGSSFVSGDACGHTGTVTGALWRPDGRYFDGVDDYIDLGDQASLEPVNVSLEVFFKKSVSAGARQLANKWTGGLKQGYVLYLQENNLRALVGNGTVATATGDCEHAVGDGTWYHAAMTYDGATLKLYVNANLVDSDTAVSGNLDYATEPFRVGRYSLGNNFFKGTIGEVRVYSRVLTPQEIQRNYLATRRRYQ